ncbi:transposable element Tc3 transposase [Trichonephila clavipes]|nr:transposable element Tc3 transposase [Trichonephila clavipes]
MEENMWATTRMNPSTSIRAVVATVEEFQSSVHRVFNAKACIHTIFKEHHHNTSQNEIDVVPDFHNRILFSDEAHFWLNGYVNKQNCRICSKANPQVYVKTPLHPEKLTICCALWAGEIIGPYFFKNDEGHNVTINGDQYRAMITNFFIPELNKQSRCPGAVVPTKRRNMSHSSCHNRFIERHVW